MAGLKLSMGLPVDESRDPDFLSVCALYADCVEVKNRTLMADLRHDSDFVALCDSLLRDQLLELTRWTNVCRVP